MLKIIVKSFINRQSVLQVLALQFTCNLARQSAARCFSSAANPHSKTLLLALRCSSQSIIVEWEKTVFVVVVAAAVVVVGRSVFGKEIDGTR